ncbi:MAG: hypothetical protein ACOYEA_05745 [Fermentimonas sp.]|jgi:hypothetical protein
MINRKYIGLFLLGLLLTVVGCDDYEAPEVSRKVEEINTSFSGVESAKSNGSGVYDVKLSNSEYELSLRLISKVGDKLLPVTGTYELSRDKEAFSIDSESDFSYWMAKSDNQKHAFTLGSIAVVSEGGQIKLNGLLSDKYGNSMRFDAKDVTFTAVEVQKVKLKTILVSQYMTYYGQGLYRVAFATEDQKIAVVLDLYNDRSENLYNIDLPSGQYFSDNSGVKNSLSTLSSYWLDADNIDAANNAKHDIKEASINVNTSLTRTTISGVVSDNRGNSIDIEFGGRLKFNETKQTDAFNAMGGEWKMTSANWRVYDKNAGESGDWVITEEEPTNFSLVSSWLPVPDYRMFFATGLWQETLSGIMVNMKDDGTMNIPLGNNANPAFIANAGMSQYIMFPTLLDAESGLFLTGNFARMQILDEHTIQMLGISTTYQGEPVVLDYFGLVGYNFKTGKYSFFTNWGFARIPRFVQTSSMKEMSQHSGAGTRMMTSEKREIEPINANLVKYLLNGFGKTDSDFKVMSVKDVEVLTADSVEPLYNMNFLK